MSTLKGMSNPSVSHVPLFYFDVKDQIYHFRCPMCGNKVSNDSNMEPLCTGPSWTDDHPHELMELIEEI